MLLHNRSLLQMLDLRRITCVTTVKVFKVVYMKQDKTG